MKLDIKKLIEDDRPIRDLYLDGTTVEDDKETKDAKDRHVAEDLDRDADYNQVVKDVDWKDLESKLSSLVGVDIKLEVQPTEKGISFESQNLADQAGVLSSIMEDLRIDTFGPAVKLDDGSLAANIHFSWKFKKGGSNGAEIKRTWYKPAEGWIF